MQLFWLSLASYWQNKAYTALVVITLTVACAGLTAVQIINATAKQSYANATQAIFNDVFWQITSTNPTQRISKNDYANLRRAGFSQMFPVLRTEQVIAEKQTGRRFRIELIGIDGFALLSLPQTVEVQPNNQANSQQNLPQLNQLWQPPYAGLIHASFAKQLSFTPDTELAIDEGLSLPALIPIEHPWLSREIILDIGVLQVLTDQPHLSEILLIGQLSNQEAETIRQLLPTHLQLENLNYAQTGQLTDSFHLNLLAMALLMFVVCLFVIMNALNLLFAKRINNYRVCRQLGVHKSSIFMTMLAELMLLSVLCAPLGTLLGYALASVLSPAVQQTLYYLYDTRIGFNQPGFVSTWLQSLGICLLGTLIAAVLPIKQLQYRLQLKQAPVMFQQKWWLIGIGLLSGLGLVTLLYGTGLSASFAVIACLLLAGAGIMILLQPICLTLLLPFARKLSATTHWALANSVALSGRCKIAFAAFFIAVASNVGMNIMVDSFRQATEQWLQTRLIAPHYVYAQDPDSFAAWLTQQQAPPPLIPRDQFEASSLTTPIELYTYPTSQDYKQALTLHQQLPDAWQDFVQGKGILVNQQLAQRFNKRLGEPLSISAKGLGDMTLPVMGVYYDYGNPKPQAILPLGRFQAAQAPNLYALHLQDEQQVQSLQQTLEKQGLQVSIQAVEQILATAMLAFDRTFIITNSLNFITLLVAAISLATSILLIAMDNSTQIALMRSLGVSRQHLFMLRLGQFSLLGIITSLLAMPFGLWLSYLLVNLVNWRAFQWSYPVLWDLQTFVQVMAMTLLVILAAAALPLLQQFRKPIADEIKCLG